MHYYHYRCAITGKKAEGTDYMSFVKSCKYAGGLVTLDNYYAKSYNTPAALPFTSVPENTGEMKGIQQLVPAYVNKYQE